MDRLARSGSGVDVIGDLEDLRPVRPAEGERWRNPDKVRAKVQLKAALDALAAMTDEAAQPARPAAPPGDAGAHPRRPAAGALTDPGRGPDVRGARTRRRGRSCRGVAATAAGAGQELALGVAADAPGGEAVGAHAHEAADDRHPAPHRDREPLAGDPGDQVGGDVGRDDPVQVGVVGRGGGQRHRRRRQLLALTRSSTSSSPSMQTRTALRTRGSSRS